MERPTGALVSSVATDGPAAKAGLKPGDVVLPINGAAIEHVDALGYRLATQSIGTTAELTVLSKGEREDRRRRADAARRKAPSAAEVTIARPQPVRRRQGRRAVAAAGAAARPATPTSRA